MAKKASRRAKAPAAAAGGSNEAAGHYEGKQHYPKALYGKKADGTIISRKVDDAAGEAQLRKESPELDWQESPKDHGLETHPAADPDHDGVVGKV